MSSCSYIVECDLSVTVVINLCYWPGGIFSLNLGPNNYAHPSMPV